MEELLKFFNIVSGGRLEVIVTAGFLFLYYTVKRTIGEHVKKCKGCSARSKRIERSNNKVCKLLTILIKTKGDAANDSIIAEEVLQANGEDRN